MGFDRQQQLPLQRNMKLASIEVARGIASVMVVFYHAARHLKADYGYLPWAGISQFGHAGVDFFFVLSGFIIFYVHRVDLGNAKRLPKYFYRRFTRIYPYFWFSLGVGILIAALSKTHVIPPISFLLLEASLLPIEGDVGVAWTLQYEVLFYIVFAVMIINLRIGICIFIAWLIFLIGTWVNYFPKFDIPILLRLSDPFDIEFFFGMAAAYLITSKHITSYKTHMWLGFILFFSAGLAENLYMLDGYTASARLLYGLGAMLLIIGITGFEFKRAFAIPKFLIEIGNASYSIYLFHLLCIGVAYKLFHVASLDSVLPVNIQYAVLVIAGVTGGMALSRIIEFPLINWVRKLFNNNVYRPHRSLTTDENPQ